MNIDRICWIVLDSVGMGPMPDASSFGDTNPNTLGHIASSIPGFELPTMQRMGLGNIDGMVGYPREKTPIGSFARLAEKSAGKDTTTGHWEMAGIITEKPFPTYPNGFGPDILLPFTKEIGRGILGNTPASGTAIIADLGDEHLKTGKPIVYTSADSVFQIAAHEKIVPIEQLYTWCRVARRILTGDNAVARVIARPFIGTSGNFVRTPNRRDFSLEPTAPTILDSIKEHGGNVAAVGKIEDIFAGKGITFAVHNQDNADGLKHTEECMNNFSTGLIYVNLVDFDMKYGHRRDVNGYAKALIEFDTWLASFIPKMKENDALFITADHGCDPTHQGTDHTREYVPLLLYGKQLPSGKNYGTRDTFADIAQTIAVLFKLPTMANGNSLL